MAGESRLMVVLEASYPELLRALILADEVVGNRDIDVLEAFSASDDEAARVHAALRGAYGDIQAAVVDYDDNAKIDLARAAAQMSVHVVSILIRVLQLGAHLGRQRLMNLDDKALRHRIDEIAKRMRNAKS